MNRTILFNYDTLKDNYVGLTVVPTKNIFSVVDLITGDTVFIMVGDLTKFSQNAQRNKQKSKIEIITLSYFGRKEKLYFLSTSQSITESIHELPCEPSKSDRENITKKYIEYFI